MGGSSRRRLANRQAESRLVSLRPLQESHTGLEESFGVRRAALLLLGLDIREVGKAHRAADDVEVELGVASPGFVEDAEEIRPEGVQLEAGQALAPSRLARRPRRRRRQRGKRLLGDRGSARKFWSF